MNALTVSSRGPLGTPRRTVATATARSSKPGMPAAREHQTPVWHNVSALPKKLAALGVRIATLEAARACVWVAVDPNKACPACGEVMQVTSEKWSAPLEVVLL